MDFWHGFAVYHGGASAGGGLTRAGLRLCDPAVAGPWPPCRFAGQRRHSAWGWPSTSLTRRRVSAAVIAHSVHWMTAIKLLGGAYLLYLGIWA